MSGYLCPVCRAPRKTELRDHISPYAHLQIALGTLALVGVLYVWGGGLIAWRGTFFYLPLWASAEFMHWARMREAAKCEVCHFDSVLYGRDPMAARRQVEAKLNIFVSDLKGKLQQKSPIKAPPAAPGDKPATETPAKAAAPTQSDKN